MTEASTEHRIARFVEDRLTELEAEANQVQVDPLLTDEGRALRLRQIAQIGEVTQDYAAAALPLIAALEVRGITVNDVGELRSFDHVDEAVPELLAARLPAIDYLPLKRDVIAALSAPWARGVASRALVEELLRVEPSTDPGPDSIRERIADSLESVLRSKDFSPQLLRTLIDLSQDETQGSARWFLIMALGRFPVARAQTVPVLLGLLNEPDLDVPAAIALGRLRATEARDPIRVRLSARQADSDQWAYREMSKALAKVS